MDELPFLAGGVVTMLSGVGELARHPSQRQFRSVEVVILANCFGVNDVPVTHIGYADDRDGVKR